MTRTIAPILAAAALAGALAPGPLWAQGRDLQTPPVPITLREGFDVPPADAQSEAIVAAARAFLDALSPEQREAAVFPFDDNVQRSNWSNFPDGPVQRAGVMRGDMTEDQLAALDGLLSTVMSEEGFLNVLYQLAAEDALAAVPDDGGPGGANFGSAFYYVSFLGEPAPDAP